jgi:hypothetical protein
MSTTQEQEIAILTDKLSELEIESRKILRALNWATKVRMILLCSLLLFVLVAAFLFYRLYSDIRYRRIPTVQQMINERPEEFSEPLTQQIMQLAEEQGPYVVDAFRQQAQEDSKLYMEAFDRERDQLITNLQGKLENKLTQTYMSILDEQEAMLKKEFPELQEAENMANVRKNMEKVYEKIGKRYYVDYLEDELETIAEKIDTFPPSAPRQTNLPLGEQIATEFLELVRMMLIHSDNYVIPEDEKSPPVSSVSPAKSSDQPNDAASEDAKSDQDKGSADDSETAKSSESKDDESDSEAQSENKESTTDDSAKKETSSEDDSSSQPNQTDSEDQD